MSKPPYVFPYQGSKRRLAQHIIQYFPERFERIVEPFAGSAAISLAALHQGKVRRVFINDINAPLMNLWRKIIYKPDDLADTYQKIWHRQLGQEKAYYNDIRDQFNATHEPGLLLFLLMRCVKASVRYNSKGEFNQSPDNRRRGTRPKTVRKRIMKTSALLQNHVCIQSCDYQQILSDVSATDIVYLDPPYQGVTGQNDPRYYDGVAYDDFVAALDDLRSRQISFIVSYDGRTGNKQHGYHLPDKLALERLEVAAGRSSQSTLLGKNDSTYESLYLSPDLLAHV